MTSKSILASAAVVAALIAGAGSPVASLDDDDDNGRGRRIKADLRGFEENPSISTPARGTFRAVISPDETQITYRLDYANLQGTVTQAHIHIGAQHVNGGISVWLCGTAALPGPAGTPVCVDPGGDGPEAEGTITSSAVVGPTLQLVAAGELAELIKAIKGGVTYANVHTSAVGSGEIRGQIKVD
jgi:hypothetical protein